jgi:DNA-binding response OmpR family regulator
LAQILVVDDEAPIVDAISYNLTKEGHAVRTAADADECYYRIRDGRPDLVVLDVMLPSGSGLDVCRRIRREEDNLPVLLLTARAAEADCLKGFEAGADDYMVKPFSMRELMARVQAVLRRSSTPAEPAPLKLEDAEEPVEPITAETVFINPERREARSCGDLLSLSRKEFDLLTLLVANRGRVFDRQTLLSRVWGEDCYVDDRTVDVHIRWLREKIEQTPARPELLLTVRGVGYKFKG